MGRYMSLAQALVTLLEDDHDQPLISRCLYHKENVVPYDLPANKTRRSLKPGLAGPCR